MLKQVLLGGAFAVGLTSAAAATPSLSFIIDGDTFTDPFSFTNTSDDGEKLVRFFIDLTGTGLVFDVINGGVPNSSLGTAFMPSGGTDFTTGFIPPAAVVDAGPTLDLNFNDFDPLEVFSFIVDVDPLDNNLSPTVLGSQMIGATAFADFSDGQRVTGVFAAIPGNSDASGFVATGITQTPAVPLPAAGWMMVAGMGALGAAARRKKKAKS